MVKSKTELISVGLPASTYLKAMDSYVCFIKDGDFGASLEDCLGAQNILDQSQLNELNQDVYKAFCSSIQKLNKSAKYYRIERFLNLVLRRN
jgi:hypothetical protein